jgi:pumilio RNA-binding family
LNVVAAVIKALRGHFVDLSQNKFSSNVVEKLVEHGSDADRESIIRELLRMPSLDARRRY